MEQKVLILYLKENEQGLAGATRRIHRQETHAFPPSYRLTSQSATAPEESASKCPGIPFGISVQ